MPEANHFPNEWHRIGTRKETHGVPENPSILLLYIPIPVSGADFYKTGSMNNRKDSSRSHGSIYSECQ
jgi:hypothetical protein